MPDVISESQPPEGATYQATGNPFVCILQPMLDFYELENLGAHYDGKEAVCNDGPFRRAAKCGVRKLT